MPRAKRLVTEAQQQITFTRRAFVLRGAQIFIGAGLLSRMGWLSVVEGEEYRKEAESNSISLSLIPPRRGWIIDRNGKPLALNRTAFRIDVIPDRMTDKNRTISELSQILNLTPEDQAKIKDLLVDAAGFQPVQISENLSWEAYAALSTRAPELPGVTPSQSFVRYYPQAAGAAHLLGYVGTASAKLYEQTKDPLLITPGFKVGKDGIERVIDARLRGTPGARRSEVTARGQLVRELANKPDIPGQNQRLTIDADLQKYVSERMGPASGACTILDCMTGDILALSSMPAYDPNNFTAGISHAEWQMLSDDDHIPLSNKVLQGLYPSGSTIKPMMALALLQAGVTPDEQVVCTGSYRVGNSIFHCDKRTGHGAISLHRALVQSCDIYFYHMGRQIGIERIAAMMRQMTLGQKYELPEPSQRYGTVPDPEWLMHRYKRPWNIYDTVNVSIGQGYLLVNPLQLAVMAGRLASGRAIFPQLLLDHSHEAAAPLAIDPAHLDFVRHAMWGVVNEGGTAAASRMNINGVELAGKTGTAQVRRILKPNEILPWKFRDHSLFIAFAPAVQPRYAGACIVEHGGQGAHAAAPIMKDVMTFLFDPATANATLTGFQKVWGGDIAQRMAIQKSQWEAAHNESTPAPENDAGNFAGNEAANEVSPTQNSSKNETQNASQPADQNASLSGKLRASPGDIPSDDVPLPPDTVNSAAPSPP
ncbi:MAG: penicillin-binding protein 2, partial [Alphaproteobacteria bacterium]|nr:penicillin-binding protein 2 [Alphaproteobacteria bacterium]